jgi:Mg-chelatase subunit ChlD
MNRWRLILGKQAEDEDNENDEKTQLSVEESGMDATLEALYDSERKAGLGKSAPTVNRWLGDIRRYFPTPVVQIMQKDALDRLGLQKMLLEKELLEAVEADVHLVGTLLSLQKIMPEKTRSTARVVVQKVVKELEKKLEAPLREAVRGALSRAVKNTRPKPNEIDWPRTIRKNLNTYLPEYQTIIPEKLVGFGKKGQALREVILCIDQSGSMAASMVYSAVFGAVLASISAIRTRVIVFDTAVVDLTEKMTDPVDLLFSTQLGGGTDIARALTYAETQISRPADTIFVLISDLFEGGNRAEMLKKSAAIKNSGVQFIAILALSDEGKPSFDAQIAEKLAEIGIPAFACTPHHFPEIMSKAIRKEPISGDFSGN